MPIPVPVIVANWNPPETDQNLTYHVYLSTDRLKWEFVTETTSTEVKISRPDIEWNRFYYVMVRTVSHLGVEAPVEFSAVDYILTVKPDLISAIEITGMRGGVDGRVVWVYWDTTIAADVTGYVIRLGDVWDTAVELANDVTSNSFQFPIRGNFVHTVLVRAKNAEGKLSTSIGLIEVDVPNLTDWPTEYLIEESTLWGGSFDSVELRPSTIISGLTQVLGISSVVGGTYPDVETNLIGTYTSTEISLLEEVYGEIGVIATWGRRDVARWDDTYAKWDLAGLTWGETYNNELNFYFRRYAGGSWSDYSKLLSGQKYYLSKVQIKAELITSDGWVSPEVSSLTIRVSKDKKDAVTLQGYNPEELPDWGGVRIVSKSGSTYTTIASALASITDASATKHYLVLVMPGLYDEQVILKKWVDIEGSAKTEVFIRGVYGTDGILKANFADATTIELRNLTIEDDSAGSWPNYFCYINGVSGTKITFDNVEVNIRYTASAVVYVNALPTSNIFFENCKFTNYVNSNCYVLYIPNATTGTEYIFDSCTANSVTANKNLDMVTSTSSSTGTVYINKCRLQDCARLGWIDTNLILRVSNSIHVAILNTTAQPFLINYGTTYIHACRFGAADYYFQYLLDNRSGTMKISSSYLEMGNNGNVILLNDINGTVSLYNTAVIGGDSAIKTVSSGNTVNLTACYVRKHSSGTGYDLNNGAGNTINICFTDYATSTGTITRTATENVNKLDGFDANQTATANTIPVRAAASTDIAMGTGALTGLRAPATTSESVRSTTKITEANLESAVDLKHYTSKHYANFATTQYDLTTPTAWTEVGDTDLSYTVDVTSNVLYIATGLVSAASGDRVIYIYNTSYGNAACYFYAAATGWMTFVYIDHKTSQAAGTYNFDLQCYTGEPRFNVSFINIKKEVFVTPV